MLLGRRWKGSSEGAVGPVRTGILGCGVVSHMYLPILMGVGSLDVVAAADVAPEGAEHACREFGVPEHLKPEEMLGDPRVELVVNLTPIPNHFETTRAALLAGKHVYSEKSLAMTSEDATTLLALADSRNLVLACAPDTLLGDGFSTARSAIDRGDIGTPVAVSAFMVRSPVGPRLRAAWAATGGALPLYDMAPYYLTAMVHLFGPARRVAAFSTGEVPRPEEDEVVAASAVVEFSSLVGQLCLVWGAHLRSEVPSVTVLGTDGELRLPNPNGFDGPVAARRYSGEEWHDVPGGRQDPRLPRNLRGLGVADTARGIREERPPRASGEVAGHVVEIIEAIVSSARTGQRVELVTTCARPAPLGERERWELLNGLVGSGAGRDG